MSSRAQGPVIDSIIIDSSQVGENQIDLWRESLAPIFLVDPLTKPPLENETFIKFYALNEIVCIDQKFSAANFIRDKQRIAKYDNDMIGLCLWLEGSNGVENAGNHISASQSAFIMDMGKPVISRATNSRCLSLAIPKPLLAQHGIDTNNLGGAHIGATDTRLSILRGALVATFEVLHQVKKAEAEGVAHSLCSLIGSIFNAQTSRCSPAEEAAIKHSIEGYIQNNLANPALDIAMISKALPYSRSSLYRHFSARGGIANYIRHERLKRCFMDLSSPVNACRSITSIAQSWGFSNSSHFSKLFKQAFSESPKDTRDRVLAAMSMSNSIAAEGELIAKANSWFS